jgi:hypothetical protein
VRGEADEQHRAQEPRLGKHQRVRTGTR